MRSIARLTPLVILVASRVVLASEPTSIYTAPAKVEILPDEATGNRVVLSGAFFFLTGATTATYGEPRCGYMSFQCPPGKEVMCRMQWRDIRAFIGRPACAGFGTWLMVSNATLHTSWGTAVKPDVWDLGMGVGTGVSVDGKCPPALKLVCATGPAPDAGPPDVAPPMPDAAPPIPDAVPVPASEPDAPAPADSVAVAADGGVPADAAVGPQPAKPSGCAVGGTGGLLPLALALVALARRARR